MGKLKHYGFFAILLVASVCIGYLVTLQISPDRAVLVAGIILVTLPLCYVIYNFERNKPSAFSIVLIALFAGAAVAGRTVLYLFPGVKPVAAIIIIGGICFGKEFGFLSGCMSMLVSNFIFSQGYWTVWQMFGMGLIGYLAGIFFYRIRIKKIWLVAVYTFVATTILYGFVVDTGSLLFYLGMRNLNFSEMWSVYAAGSIFNVTHGISATLFSTVLLKPLSRAADRVKQKISVYKI